jgi:hypothetical protein
MKINVSQPVIEEVFKDFYEVPAFQREYVWAEDQVKALLDDAFDALFDENGSPVDTEYFIGSIVTYQDNDVFQLIDGQQRLTTLFIVLCAIRDARVGARDKEDLSHWHSLIQASSVDDDGRAHHKYRLTPLYEDASDMLQKIGAGHFLLVQDTRALSTSARNMAQAYLTAREFLERFSTDLNQLRRFGARLIKRVRLVRIETANVTEALRIFETINDRGIGLNAMDLLKNLLFMESNRDSFDKLTAIWKEMVRTIEHKDVREKPLRFLRYFLLSKFADARNRQGKPLTEDDLYEWLERSKSALGIDTNPLGFAKELKLAAEEYKAHVTSPDVHLRYIYRLSPRARQHLIVMLATKQLTALESQFVSSRLEALLVGFLLAKEPTKALDLIFANAAPKLREIGAQTELSPAQRMEKLRGFFATWLDPEIAKRMPRIDDALARLSLERKTMTRFVLARISQFVEQLANSPPAAFDHYWDYQIEHVLPFNPTEVQRRDFDAPEKYDELKQMLGNLVLLEQSINGSVGRGFFTEKQAEYKKSSLFATRSLVESQKLGESSAFTKAAAWLPTYLDWTSKTIRQRQLDLIALARHIWGYEGAAHVAHD